MSAWPPRTSFAPRPECAPSTTIWWSRRARRGEASSGAVRDVGRLGIARPRQLDDEPHPGSVVRERRDLSAVAFDDAPADGEADAGSRYGAVGRAIEDREHALGGVRRKPATVVPHLDRAGVGVVRVPLVHPHQRRLLATVLHGVLDEVAEEEPELLRVAGHDGQWAELEASVGLLEEWRHLATHLAEDLRQVH